MADERWITVTGATGLIAKHTIRALIERGYRVRGTVRSLPRALAVVKAAGLEPGDERLSFVACDLERDEGWDQAVAGASGVLHIASPLPIRQPRDRDELIRPARGGTLRVLKAAAAAGVPRVVMTSSTAAILHPSVLPRGRPFTEEDWTDPTRGDVTPYVASKTLAERAAWDFVAATPGAPELVALNPGVVLGPALDADLSASHQAIRLLIAGGYPAVPRLAYPMVDVRDVAAAHLAALERPAARGQRYLIVERALSILDMARIIAETYPARRGRLPRFELPDLLVRALGLFEPRMASIVDTLGHPNEASNAKARAELGLTFRPAREALIATVESLAALRLI